MPRTSAASLSVIQPSRAVRLVPSKDAPEDVRRVFVEIVVAAPATWFQRGDAPIIEAYAEAICLARRASIELDRDGPVMGGRASPWLTVQEKAHRAIAALSARLRLSPQHRATSQSAGRKAGGLRPSAYEVADDES